MAELIVTKLAKDFQKNLFPDNSFYLNARRDETGMGIAKVQVGNSGSVPEVIVNPTVFPLVASERVDTIKEYSLHEFATPPQVVRWANQFTLDYDKGKILLEDHKNEVLNKLAIYILDAWYHTWDYKTTGSNRAATAPGATGNRKAVTQADLIGIINIMDRDDIPDDGGRYAILPPAMYADIAALEDFTLTQAVQSDLIRKGVLGEIYGVKLMKRSSTPVFDSAFAKKAIGTAGAATDNLSSLFWHKNFVRFGNSKVEIFMNKKQGGYLGDTLNVSLLGNGMVNRNDLKGTYTLTQTV